MKCLFINHENECPAYPDGCGDCADAHSCREHMNDYGICQWCGAVVWGTPADYDFHDREPACEYDDVAAFYDDD